MAPMAAWRALDFNLRVLIVLAAVVAVSWGVNRWIERPLSKRLRAMVDPAASQRQPRRRTLKLRPEAAAR